MLTNANLLTTLQQVTAGTPAAALLANVAAYGVTGMVVGATGDDHGGNFDPITGVITFNPDLTGWGIADLFVHEVAHAINEAAYQQEIENLNNMPGVTLEDFENLARLNEAAATAFEMMNADAAGRLNSWDSSYVDSSTAQAVYASCSAQTGYNGDMNSSSGQDMYSCVADGLAPELSDGVGWQDANINYQAYEKKWEMFPYDGVSTGKDALEASSLLATERAGKHLVGHDLLIQAMASFGAAVTGGSPLLASMDSFRNQQLYAAALQ